MFGCRTHVSYLITDIYFHILLSTKEKTNRTACYLHAQGLVLDLVTVLLTAAAAACGESTISPTKAPGTAMKNHPDVKTMDAAGRADITLPKRRKETS